MRTKKLHRILPLLLLRTTCNNKVYLLIDPKGSFLFSVNRLVVNRSFIKIKSLIFSKGIWKYFQTKILDKKKTVVPNLGLANS